MLRSPQTCVKNSHSLGLGKPLKLLFFFFFKQALQDFWSRLSSDPIVKSEHNENFSLSLFSPLINPQTSFSLDSIERMKTDFLAYKSEIEFCHN